MIRNGNFACAKGHNSSACMIRHSACLTSMVARRMGRIVRRFTIFRSGRPTVRERLFASHVPIASDDFVR